MLRTLHFDHWKSFGAATDRSRIQLAPLSLLVGPNGSGKSNALDGLRFLQGAAFDYPLADVLRGRWEGQREIWPAIRGSIVEAPHAGRDRFAIQTTWGLESHRIEHRLSVSTDGDVAVEAESLSDADGHGFETEAAPGEDGEPAAVKVALRGTDQGSAQDRDYASDRSLLRQVGFFARSHPVALSAHVLRDALREMVFLDVRPALMREYRPLNGGHLGAAGENISPVIRGLPEAQREDIVGWLAELCAPEITGIEFDETKLREVMMILVERDGRKVSARSASDGTLKFLGEVVALLTAPRGSVIVLEEPDVGLHPSRIRLLVELLEYVTGERGVQVIATTHSSAMLAHLKPDALANVVAFARDPDTGDTMCSRAGDLPHFEQLRDARDAEHLLSTGWLERAF